MAGTAAAASIESRRTHLTPNIGGATPAKKSKKKKTNRWVATVTTDSTHPDKGLFTKSAATIAKQLASKRVSPKGPGSGMRMLTYYINRAGHNLSAERRAELEKAKELLSKRIAREKESHRQKDAA